jgi:hypothetical protein
MKTTIAIREIHPNIEISVMTYSSFLKFSAGAYKFNDPDGDYPEVAE